MQAGLFLTDSSPSSRSLLSNFNFLSWLTSAAVLLTLMGCGGDAKTESDKKVKSSGSTKVADAKEHKAPDKKVRTPLTVDRTGSSDQAKKGDTNKGLANRGLANRDGAKKDTKAAANSEEKSSQSDDDKQEPKPSVPATFPTLLEARKFGWEAATLIATSLQPETSSQTFEGMKAWKTDFLIAQGKVNLEKPKTLDAVDVEKLITNNPNFWRMFYEVTPGDPAMAFMLAGFFLASGDANKASSVVHIFRHHRGDEVKNELDLLQTTATDVIKEGMKQLADGHTLFGKEQFKAAEQEFLKATKLWPKNGMAWLEAARANDTFRAREGDGESTPVYKRNLANARRFLPFEMETYQGDEKLFKLLQSAITGSEAWKEIKEARNGVEDEHLSTLVTACSGLGTIDLALFAQQVLIARRRRYTEDDALLIEGLLQKAAPDHPTVETVKRLKSLPVSFYVLSKGAPPKSAGNAIALPSKFAPRTKGVKLESLQILTEQKVFFEQLQLQRFTAFQKSLEEVIYKVLGDSNTSYKIRIQVTMHIPRRSHLVRITHRGKVPKDKVKTLEEKLQAVSTIYTKDATVEYALFVDVRSTTQDDGNE